MTAQRQIENKLVHEPLNAGNTVLEQDFGKFGLLCSSLENIRSEQLSRVLDDFLSQGFVFASFGKIPPQKTTRVKQNHATAVSKVVLASDMQAGNTDVAQRLIVRQRAHVCVEMKSRKTGTRGLEGQLHVTEMLAENNTSNDRPTIMRTHQPVVLTLEGVKRGRLVQRLKRPTRLPRIAPVGPSRRTPSNDVLLGMMRECEHQTHSDAVVRATLDEAALQCGRTVETEVLGRDTLSTRKNTQAGWQCPSRDSDSSWSGAGRTGCGRRSRTLETSGASYRRPSQHACEGIHGQGLQHHLQHTSQDLQPAVAFLSRPARAAELVDELAQGVGTKDGCKAAGGAANLHASGWSA